MLEVVLFWTVLLLDEGAEKLDVVQTGWRAVGKPVHLGLPFKFLTGTTTDLPLTVICFDPNLWKLIKQKLKANKLN